jgi:hypothetical protein
MATALNIVHNAVVYPALGFMAGVAAGVVPYTEADRGWIMLGLLVAMAETVARLRGGLFSGKPVSEIRLGAALYGVPLALALRPLIRRFMPQWTNGRVPVEGFYGGGFDEKRERERRYGEVYTVTEFDRGYHVCFELPRRVPPSGARNDLGISAEMPEYDLGVGIDGSVLTVRGSVVDPLLRSLCGVSSAFPADFKTDVALDGPLGGFRHRYGNKLLEVAVLRQGA